MYGKALETSMNAAGTLEKQQEIAMESLANKMDVLKATAEDLYDSLFDTDTIGGFIDAGTNVLQFLADFTDGVGGLNNILPLLITSLTQLFSGQIANGIGSIINNFRIANQEAEMATLNAEHLKEMFKDSEMVKQMNSQGPVGQAAAANFEQLGDFYNRMQQYQHLMTEEEQKQYKLILENTVALGNKEVLLAEMTDAWKKNASAAELIEETLIDDTTRVGELNTRVQELSQLGDSIEESVIAIGKNNLQNLNSKQFTTLTKVLKELNGEFVISDRSIQLLEKEFALLRQNTDSTEEALQLLVNKLKG